MRLLPEKFYFDNLFDDFFVESKKNDMKCDIYEKGGAYHIELDIPGYNKDEINVDYHDGNLLISATKDEATEEEDKNYIRKERVFGSVQRRFYIGEIDPDDIKAEFKNGILKLIVPKEEKKLEKKQIVIE